MLDTASVRQKPRRVLATDDFLDRDPATIADDADRDVTDMSSILFSHTVAGVGDVIPVAAGSAR